MRACCTFEDVDPRVTLQVHPDRVDCLILTGIMTEERHRFPDGEDSHIADNTDPYLMADHYAHRH